MKPTDVFQKVMGEKRNNLTELEAREILKYYRIPVVRGEVVKTIEGALNFAEKHGYPLALKVVSRQIIHKTDVGGVILNVGGEKELRSAFEQIIKNVRRKKRDAIIDGIFVQEMMESAPEVIIGGKMDHTFGHIILFGLGGVFVDVFDDVAIRVVPISRKDAYSMIQEIKGYRILQGYRGGEPSDLRALVDILMKTSRMLEENQEIKELDINPVFALPDRAVAVDARIIIE